MTGCLLSHGSSLTGAGFIEKVRVNGEFGSLHGRTRASPGNESRRFSLGSDLKDVARRPEQIG